MERLILIEGTGLVGGRLLELQGEATLDEAGRALVLSVRVTGSSLLVDPAIVVLGVLDLVLASLVATGRAARPRLGLLDDEAHAHVHGQLLEEGVREVGSLDAVAHLHEDGEAHRLRFELLRADVAAEPGELVSALDAVHAPMVRAAGEDRVAAISTLPISTSRGRDFSLVVTTVLEPAEVEAPAVLIHVEGLVLRRTEGVLQLTGRLLGPDLHPR